MPQAWSRAVETFTGWRDRVSSRIALPGPGIAKEVAVHRLATGRVYDRSMDDLRVGAVIRAIRIKRRWRQIDLAARAGVSASVISDIERGHLDGIPLRTIRRATAAVDVRLEYVARWRGGELDRLLNARHSAMHESMALHLATMPDGQAAPEVSFSIYGERGVVDVLAWHARTSTALVIELKTDIVDVRELLGSLDRKRRLASTIAHERGWGARNMGVWLVILDSSATRRRFDAHRAVFSAALPDDGRRLRGWLREPRDGIAAASFWPADAMVPALRSQQRVRQP